MHNLSRWAALAIILILLAPAALLEGCGGGGGGGGSAASAVSSGASTATSVADTGASTVAGSPSPAASVPASSSPSPSPGASTTPTPTPYGPAGAHVLSGTIADERLVGLSNVAIAAQPLNAPSKLGGKIAFSAASAPPLSTSTGADGSYSLPGFNTGQYYALTIERFDRKTMRTVFKFDPESSDQSILLIAPKGTGLVEFELPSQRKLSANSAGSNVIMTWDTSINPGFTNYTLYRSMDANRGLSATAFSTLQSPTDIRYTDTRYTDQKVSSPPVTYYRLYEKVFVPELGTFVMMGSNEVPVTFPQVVISPSDKDTDVPTAAPITLQFSATMDQASAAGALTVTSHGLTDETLTGTTNWAANTMTFTPRQPLKLARIITARLSGARDGAGNTIGDLAATFTVTSGYTSTPGWYSASLPNPIEVIGWDPAGFVVYSYTKLTDSVQGPKRSVEIRSLAGFQGMGTDGGLSVPYPSPSPTVSPSPSPVTARLDLVDAAGNLWLSGTSQYGEGAVEAGFSAPTPGSVVSPIYDGTRQAVDVTYVPPFITGDVTLGQRSIEGVSSADVAKIFIGMKLSSSAYFQSGTITGIYLRPSGEYSVGTSSSAISGGNRVSVPMGPSKVAYGISASPITIGAPWNLDAGAINVYAGYYSTFLNQYAYDVAWRFYDYQLVPPGARGSLAGQYSTPSGLAVDSSGNIYIGDRGNARIVVFDRTSLQLHTGSPPYPGYIGSFGTAGTGGFGKFGAGGMGQVVVDSDHYVYVVDGTNGLVQKFAGVGVSGHQLGDFITQLPYGGGSGVGVGTPVCVDSDGNLYSVSYNAATNLNSNITKSTRLTNP